MISETFDTIGAAVETAAPFIEAELAAVAIVGAVHVFDKLTGRETLRRSIRCAAILTGATGCTWKRPKELALAVWRGSDESLPMPGRLLIAPGVFAPILGPVDEAAALVTAATLCAVPSFRETIKAAWTAAAS